METTLQKLDNFLGLCPLDNKVRLNKSEKLVTTIGVAYTILKTGFGHTPSEFFPSKLTNADGCFKPFAKFFVCVCYTYVKSIAVRIGSFSLANPDTTFTIEQAGNVSNDCNRQERSIQNHIVCCATDKRLMLAFQRAIMTRFRPVWMHFIAFFAKGASKLNHRFSGYNPCKLRVPSSRTFLRAKGLSWTILHKSFLALAAFRFDTWFAFRPCASPTCKQALVRTEPFLQFSQCFTTFFAYIYHGCSLSNV